MGEKCVRMIQVSRYRWNLVAPKGSVMVEGLLCSSSYEAEEWVKKYVSSWPTWSYEVITRQEKSV